MNIGYEEFNPYIVGCGIHGEVEKSAPGIRYPLRVTRWYELELYHSVDQGYIINGDHRFNLEKGMLMMRKPGTVVRGVSSYSCHSITFDNIYDEALNSAYAQGMFENPTVKELEVILSRTSDFLMAFPEGIKMANYTHIDQLFRRCLENYLRKEEDFQLQGKRILYEIIAHISAEVKDGSAGQLMARHDQNENYQALLRTKIYMEETYKKKITLTQLAEMTGYSKEAFCRKYSQLFNGSPIDYLVNVRLTHARKWLITTDKTIEEIAFLCGFKSDSYFYRVFKKRSGMPPVAYRKAHQIY